MPSQVAARPITADQRIARPGLLVSRRPAAAGPTSSAVLRMAPMVRADSDTASAIAIRHKDPVARTGIPRAKASSGLAEPSNSGRYRPATTPSAIAPSNAAAAVEEPLMVKMEPNRTVIVASVVLVVVVPQ